MAAFPSHNRSARAPSSRKALPSKTKTLSSRQQSSSGQTIRIVLADDDATVRQGLRMRLSGQPNMRVIGEAADGEAALRLIQELAPDVVVMDIEMPYMDGITAMQKARVLVPHTRIVILTVYDDAGTQERARAAGAAALVGKLEDSQALLQAIIATATLEGS